MPGEQKLVRGNSSLNPNFPGNTDTKVEEKPKPKVVAKGLVNRRKKSIFQRITSSLTSHDGEQSIGDHILFDILIPTIKTTIVDAVTTGIEMIFFGEQRTRPSNVRRDGTRSYVSYNAYYQGNENRKPIQARSRYDFEDIEFKSRAAAEEVLSEMGNEIEQYGMVSVAFFYDICGLDHAYTDQDYGWTSLREAYTEIGRSRQWFIRFPRVIPIK